MMEDVFYYLYCRSRKFSKNTILMKIVGDVFDSNHYTKGLTARQRLIFQLCKTDEHISIDLRFKKQLRLVARRGLEYNKTVKEKHPFQGGDKT